MVSKCTMVRHFLYLSPRPSICPSNELLQQASLRAVCLLLFVSLYVSADTHRSVNTLPGGLLLQGRAPGWF